LQSFTWSAFDHGPADRVLDIVLRCQESSGEYELESELARFFRLIRWSNEAEWSSPVTTVAALLDLAAELWAAEPDDLIAPSFKEKVSRACGDSDQSGYLHTLAGIVRELAQGAPADLDELPFSPWESEIVFRRLQGFSGNWVDDGEYETLEESMAAAIDSEHPFCAEYLGPISAEAQVALVRQFQSPQAGVALARLMPWATAEGLSRVLDIINDHMRHAHGPNRP
jgi:hypothetical protein